MPLFLSDLTIFDAFGLLGFALYLAAFGSLQFGWLDGNGTTYPMANIVAAGCVLIGLVEAFNLASALIQVSWIVIGYVGICRRRRYGPQVIGRSVPA